MAVKKLKLDIRSSDRLWTPDGAGSTGLSPQLALAELVANSIDWCLLSKDEFDSLKDDAKNGKTGAAGFLQKLESKYGAGLKTIISPEPKTTSNVEISIYKNAYYIIDNGVGMTQEELQDGLRLRGASNETRPNLRPRKGKFGMGMKSGILTLGWKITIWTRSVLSPGKELRVKIDCRQIDSGAQKLEDIEATFYDSGDDKDSPLEQKGFGSGTAILITDLVSPVGGPAYYSEILGECFTPDIRNKIVELSVIDNKSDPSNPTQMDCTPRIDVYDPTFTEVKIDSLKIMIAPDDGGAPQLLRGWLKMLTKGRPGGERKFGFNLFRKGQLIESWHNTGGVKPSSGIWPKRLHTNHSKLIGELHLDMCSPNYTKAGWDRNSNAWKTVKEKLKEELNKAIEIAGKPKEKLTSPNNIKAWDALFSATKATISALSTKTGSGAATNTSNSGTVVDKTKVTENTITLKDGRNITIAAVKQANLKSEEPWTHYWEDSTKELIITYNKNSELFKSFATLFQTAAKNDQSKTISAWAVCDSLLLLLTNPNGPFKLSIEEAMGYRVKWLKIVFTETNNLKTKPKTKSETGKLTTGDKEAIEQKPSQLTSKQKTVLKLVEARKMDISDIFSKLGFTESGISELSSQKCDDVLAELRGK